MSRFNHLNDVAMIRFLGVAGHYYKFAIPPALIIGVKCIYYRTIVFLLDLLI